MRTPPNPGGLCLCGCGRTTPIAAKHSIPYGHVKGEHVRYCVGHHRRSGPVDFIVDEATGCWIWQLAKMRNGYGQKWDGKRLVSAHRWHYEQVHGPVPVELDLDHLCRHRDCVNPAHLEPVTRLENVRRGAGNGGILHGLGVPR